MKNANVGKSDLSWLFCS